MENANISEGKIWLKQTSSNIPALFPTVWYTLWPRSLYQSFKILNLVCSNVR